ncbi:MAG TPA: 6-phospho-beta-glucosidase [Anaerolineaceae bacterium]|nr:6-phospho-beta-glucosidase [Anaerolineaceae bacterium]HPN51139.1 6-phospho-beta-glucosidase [Anaerolineaceae bacterium]
MKITVIGGGGARTPLMVQAVIERAEQLGLRELCLMDIDQRGLDLMAGLTRSLEKKAAGRLTVNRTTDLKMALYGADFVLTTFRVGNMPARVIDERVPLKLGLLGQETTGAGGFAMAMRTIPEIKRIIDLMKAGCPDAWLVNFANPSGLITEMILTVGGWRRAVGICDAPSSMQAFIAALLKLPREAVRIEYFGLNHLGWIRRIWAGGQDVLPDLIGMAVQTGHLPEMAFSPRFIAQLGMLPNEYLYYYYNSRQAVQHIQKAEQTRGEQILEANQRLFARLDELGSRGDEKKMQVIYEDYLSGRGQSYMKTETDRSEHDEHDAEIMAEAAKNSGGYAGVALDLIESLAQGKERVMILNTLNRGAISGMDEREVVEIPVLVGRDRIEPLAVGEVPGHALGLMKQVKAYEQMTIAAAMMGSYEKALTALTIHPLVADEALARQVLDQYILLHEGYFPRLS